jgi:hypothetical protein
MAAVWAPASSLPEGHRGDAGILDHGAGTAPRDHQGPEDLLGEAGLAEDRLDCES